jgi:ligand-binding sensor domain-containing protein
MPEEQEQNRIAQEAQLSNKIWMVYQDTKMNYWFGSNGQGVYKYDGTKLICYNHANGLVDNQIRGIQEDKFGNLYFDTPSGVSKFNGESFETLRAVEGGKWEIGANDLWFKGNGDFTGAYRYDGEQLYALKFPYFDLEEGFGRSFEVSRYSPWGTYSIYQDQKGHLWFGTLAAGVLRFDGKDWLWIAEEELTTLEDGRVPAIRAIFEDQEGYFWLSHALFKYKIDNPKGGKADSYKKTKAIDGAEEKMGLAYFNSALVDDESGVIWMTVYSEDLWKYENGALSSEPVVIEGEKAKLVSVYKDRLGKLWLGTDNLGILSREGEQFLQFQLEN